MRPCCRLALLLLFLRASGAGAAPGLSNPYYNACPGSARLTTHEQLHGRFYYHRAPFSQQVVFYYYPQGPSSRRKIPAAQIQHLTVRSRRDTTQQRTFERQQGRLVRTLADGTQQALTRARFSE
ncbi:hypothetical protein SAMN04515668_4379 [Hymenobacter arizonensis]|uniref:Uncharacterized protein n=2 Tax=Hymenobacter arizonensis TaxID=1227077 RepID=A0A1I6BDA6_HYMAR|nr:hypothetical protein SAMN04515668_4379 [Hymenobacter arizonensis]